jgi:streptogramin lyase
VPMSRLGLAADTPLQPCHDLASPKDMKSIPRQRRWVAAGRVPVWFVVSIAMVATGSCAAPAARQGASTPPAANAGLGEIGIALGGEVDDLAAGGGYVWAFVRDTGVLIRVDQRTGKVRCFALGVWRGMPVVTAATRHAVWLAD